MTDKPEDKTIDLRVDTVGFDEESNSFVIIEYKLYFIP
jgi:hypothetical protein